MAGALISLILVVVAAAWFGLAALLMRLLTRRPDGEEIGPLRWIVAAVFSGVLSAIIVAGSLFAILAFACAGSRLAG